VRNLSQLDIIIGDHAVCARYFSLEESIGKPRAKVFAKTLQKKDNVTTIHMPPSVILLHLIQKGDEGENCLEGKCLSAWEREIYSIGRNKK
jgi:hypothetical protein